MEFALTPASSLTPPDCVVSDQHEPTLHFCFLICEIKVNSLTLRTFLLVTFKVFSTYPSEISVLTYNLPSPSSVLWIVLCPPALLPSVACPGRTCGGWCNGSLTLWLPHGLSQGQQAPAREWKEPKFRKIRKIWGFLSCPLPGNSPQTDCASPGRSLPLGLLYQILSLQFYCFAPSSGGKSSTGTSQGRLYYGLWFSTPRQHLSK